MTLRLFLTLCLALPICPIFGFAGTPQTDIEAKAHAERGRQLARRGDLKAVESEARQAAVLVPGEVSYLTLLGKILAAQNELEESSHFLEGAFKIDPADPAHS